MGVTEERILDALRLDLPEHGGWPAKLRIDTMPIELGRILRWSIRPAQGASDGLKRLTAEAVQQYRWSDLFSECGLGSGRLSFELDVDGFDNNTAVNTATPTLVETYFDAGFVVAGTVARAAENVLPCDPVTAGCEALLGWRPPAVLGGDEI